MLKISSIVATGSVEVGCSGGASLVTMVQPTHFRDRNNSSRVGRLDRPGLRAVLLQCQMRSTSMIVIDEALKVSVQAAFVEYDHVIQALAANRADHAFNIRTLPGRPRRRQDLLYAHRLYLVHEVFPEDPIAISQQISRRRIPWEGFAQLLSRPLGCWVSRYGEMHDTPAIMREHQKYVEDLEPDRWY